MSLKYYLCIIIIIIFFLQNYYTVKPLYCRQHWDIYKCPDYRGVLISGVNLYYKAQFGTFVSLIKYEYIYNTSCLYVSHNRTLNSISGSLFL